ncbi:hypothetical protein A9B99_02595 [Mangrovibacter phragmitis]|uniref:Uncharacterized protein n=2 Tax=Mangrovibacter phragmitis TaxID=1691903 RepID=A0A1B7LAC3_9ENTR|nr:hypothetical protein A9B99_02595 [Mangrovibacter phragmitis]
MARFYGVHNVNPANASVLELGCGEGQLLLSHALAYPDSQCLGFDLNEEAIERGKLRLEKMHRENIAIGCISLDEIIQTQGNRFDFIIIHGIYSLLPGETRQALLAWCKSQLSENGLIAFEWMTLPGSSHEKTLQDAIALHTIEVENDIQYINSIRGIFSFLSTTATPADLKKYILQEEARSDEELLLKYKHNFNYPEYLVDFNSEVNRAGLQYVGDVLPFTEMGEYYDTQTRQMLDVVSKNKHKIIVQQYFDFAVQKTKRFSLLISENYAGELRDTPDLNEITNLQFAGYFARFTADDGEVGNGHYNYQQHCISTSDALTLSVMDCLGDAWPYSVSFEQVVISTFLPEDPEDHREKVKKSLQGIFMKKIPGFFYSSQPGPYNRCKQHTIAPIIGLDSFDETLKATPVEENDESEAPPVLVRTGKNYWGITVEITSEELELLNRQIKIDTVGDIDVLMSLREKALLQGSPIAWKKKIQECLALGDPGTLKKMIMSLLIFSCHPETGGFMPANAYNLSEGKEAVTDSGKKMAATAHKLNDLISQGEYETAREVAARAIHQEGKSVGLLLAATRACLITGAYQDALPLIAQLLSLHATNWDYFYDLANAFMKTKSAFYSGRVIRAVIRANPKQARPWDLLACLYRDFGEYAPGLVCSRKAVECEPETAHYLTNLGTLLGENNLVDEAKIHMKRAVEISNGHLGFYSNYLFLLAHDPNTSVEERFQEHCGYGDKATEWQNKAGVKFNYSRDKNPDRKLRLGFVSGDFFNHPVSHFLRPFWDNINRQEFFIVGYNNSETHDKVTDHFESTSNLWREIRSYSSVELAKQINKDEIDILIDLSGHTTNCRLTTFALKPAPVQMTWIGYPATTGLTQIDYRIMSTGFVKQSELAHRNILDDQFREKIIYVPMKKLFEPNPKSPDVNLLPALANGYITFGSFNRPKKINDNVLNLWGKLLKRNPGAKFIMGFMTGEKMVEFYKGRLIELGAREEQLIFRQRMKMNEYLEYHHNIDLLLDAFPYSGGTTTNHAAWMGVPTLTLCGDTMAGRQGMEIMNQYGLDDFIADDADDYITKAEYWASHITELAEIRATMRQKMITSLSDYNVSDTFEKALRAAWKVWVNGEDVKRLVISE